MAIDIIWLDLFVQAAILHQLWKSTTIHLLRLLVTVLLDQRILMRLHVWCVDISVATTIKLVLLNVLWWISVYLNWQLILLDIVVVILASVYQLPCTVHINFVTIIRGGRGATLIFRVLRESTCYIYSILHSWVKTLVVAIVISILWRFLAQLSIRDLVRGNLISRELY